MYSKLDMLKDLYDDVAEAYKEAVVDGRKIAAKDYVKRLKFYETRLAEYDL